MYINITTYQEPDGTTTYEYDAMSQLTKATKGSTIYTYTYDGGGNILTASGGGTNHTYTYGYSDWKDLLTAYDGHGITYNGVGNPVTYYNGTEWEFDWTDGRKLTEAESTNGTRVTYLYDVDGTRRSKTVDGVTHTYIWEDGRPLKEYVSGNTDIYIAGETMYFFYDQDGRPFLLRYNNANYYYILNLQGDVVRLVSDTGENMATYEYDPYGNIISAAGEMAEVNPLRYRGYYYDAETGLYYVSSRYYDPAIGRFISADSAISGVGGDIRGYNMYSYCFNNPVNMSDPTGDWPKWVETAAKVVSVVAVVAAVVVTVAAVSAFTAGTGSVAAVYGASIFLGAALSGINGAVANSKKGNSYANGYVGGATGGGIQAACSKTPAGTIAGGGIGVTVGTAITDTLNNLDPDSQNSTKAQMIKNATTSGMKALVTSSVTAYVGYSADLAKVDGAGGLMPSFTYGFAEGLKTFFGWADDAVIYVWE